MADWRHHDLRRTVATRMADLGIEPHVMRLSSTMSPAPGGVAGVYNRSLYAAESVPPLRHGLTTSGQC